MQQFGESFRKNGNAWHMILGDIPDGHGFVLRDLVLIELSGYAARLLQLGGRGVKNFRKVFAGGVGGSEILILVGGRGLYCWGMGGHVILK